MIFTNALSDCERINKQTYSIFLQLLAPFAPHMTEELWSLLGNTTSIHLSHWPEYTPELTVNDTIEIAVQVNGKLRGTFTASRDITQTDAIAEAKTIENVAKFLVPGPLKKEIYVKGRLVNFVV